MKLHPKIEALRLKAKPVNTSGMYVDADGNLQDGVDLKLKVVDEEARTVEGYLSVFNVVDYAGELILKGAFTKSIKERGPASNAKYKILMLWQHDMCEPIGQFTDLKEDDYGLYFKAVLDPIPTADRALIQIKSGTINQFSIGYDYVWDKVYYDETLNAIILPELELYEGSAVTMGCNAETYAIKSAGDMVAAKENLDMETDDILRDIPRNKRLEIKQLISKHISLAQLEPNEIKLRALEEKKRADQAEQNKFNLSVILKNAKQL